jgi:hypothetical protein
MTVTLPSLGRGHQRQRWIKKKARDRPRDEMAELTLEALRADLKAETRFHPRSTRRAATDQLIDHGHAAGPALVRAALNDLTRTNVTAGLIEALHADVKLRFLIFEPKMEYAPEASDEANPRFIHDAYRLIRFGELPKEQRATLKSVKN